MRSHFGFFSSLLDKPTGAARTLDIARSYPELLFQLGNLLSRDAGVVRFECRKTQPKLAQLAPVRLDGVGCEIVYCA